MRLGRIAVSLLALALALTLAGRAAAQDTVSVPGGSHPYPTSMNADVGDKKVQTKLTGAGMRKKAIFNVYTVGSYVQGDFAGNTPEALADADTVKQLHLVMQRNVGGKDMAEAFITAIRANYPGDVFAAELAKFEGVLQAQDIVKGDQVWITHIPGYGVHVNLVGKRADFIKNVKFSKAIWDIYLGPKNVGEPLKRALISRL